MKKLLIKDKRFRFAVKKQERYYFVFKSIFQNSNIFMLIRWNAYFRLKIFAESSSKISVLPRCVYTINRKRFNRSTPFSRHVLFKLIQSGKVSGVKKSSW